ncbi:MAG: HlyD family secretion protein [Thermodesulfovibrionaceae bacterium]
MAKEIYYYIRYESTDNAYVEGIIIPISPQVSGKVIKVYVDHNQKVKRGDPLVEIEPDDYLADVSAKEENIRAIENQIKEIISSINEAESKLKVAESNFEAAQAQKVFAEKEYERIKTLYQEELISKSKFDSAEAALKVAIAQQRAAENQIREIKFAIQTLNMKLRTLTHQMNKSQQELKISKLNLKRTLIVSPIDGRVAKKSVEFGQFVRQGQLLMAVVDEKSIWIGANFKETQIEKMRVGQPVKIKVDAYPGKVFKGRVDSFQPGTGAVFSLFPPENATGNFVKVVQRIPVRIAIESPYDPEYPLWPGMSVIPYVDITVKTGKKLKEEIEKR